MDAWNPDLTWLIFARAHSSRSRDGMMLSEFSRIKRKMDERILKEIIGRRFSDDDDNEEDKMGNVAGRQQLLRFAELRVWFK